MVPVAKVKTHGTPYHVEEHRAFKEPLCHRCSYFVKNLHNRK